MSKINIENIKKLVKNGNVRWTNHVILRLIQREISQLEVEEAILNGEIIEEYENDYPYPSCLIYGCSIKNKILHIVCGITESEVWIITAYHPNIIKWNEDLKTRKEKN